MKRLTHPKKLLAASFAALAVLAGQGWAQTAPAANPVPAGAASDQTAGSAVQPVVSSTSAAPAEDQTIMLDPFTVSAENEGYAAVDTLGGARVRTKLADTPSSLSVVTPAFMQDLGITNALDLLVYTADTDVAGLNGTYSGVSARGFGVAEAGESQRLIDPEGVNRARGLSPMDNTRNYFDSEIPWDSFNISRVDISRGPNSFLFGVGSPSGIANVSTNEAIYKDQGSVVAHYGSFGTTRYSLDYNKVLIPQELALRIDMVDDDTQYQQNPAYNHTERIYGALRFDPKVFATDSSHMKIEANYEAGQGNSNNPREMPPLDFITGYYSGLNKAGYNPYTFNPQTIDDPSTGAGNSYYDPKAGPWVNNGDMHYAWGNNATYYFNAQGQLLQATQAGQGGLSYPNGQAAGSYSPAGFDGASNVYHLYTNGFGAFAENMNAINSSMFPGANAGTVTYLNKTLSDSSIYDFYNLLIDGPNKQEWQNWNTFNLNVEESLLNDHLAVQFVIDHEDYTRGQQGLLIGNMSPYISVNLDSYTLTYPSWISGASANPYEGMPFVGNDVGSGNNSSSYINNNYQMTVSGSLNFQELMPNSPLAKVLGHHELTALGGVYITREDDRSWQEYATSATYGAATGNGLTVQDNNINWVAFLGPSLTGTSSPAGLHLSNMANPMIPTSGPVTVWNGTWTAGSSVSPSAAWTNPMPGNNSVETQADNPANYAGYQPLQTNVLDSKNNLSQLYTAGDLSEQKLSSLAFMYQGYFWDDTIIPEVGVRRDEVLQRGDDAPVDAATGVASMNYNLTDPGVTLTTTSTSYGLTLHLPKMLKAKLPEGTDVSVYYFHGDNETPKVRYSIDGNPLPSETGKTDDYSIRFDALNGHATLKISAFKTVDQNASASYGQPLGSVGWLIDSLPTWTLCFAADGEIAAHTPVSQMPSDLASNSWVWSWATTNPQLADNIASAIQKYFPTMFPQSYWDQYGIPVSMAAVESGNWLHILSDGDSPLAWDVANTHLIHGVYPTIDQNIESKGFEIEATIRPVLNWDLTFNVSKVNAWQTSLGADAENYLNGLASIWLTTPVGQTPEWGSVTSPMSQQFLSGLWAPYLEQVALSGTEQPELSRWNMRGVTNYTFNRGWTKGINVGGAFRWQSAAILGYGISQQSLFGNTAWLNDVNKPLYGLADYHFDAWIGYQHKVTSNVTYKLQLNLRNVGEKPHLVPINVEPDGTFAQQRIEEGQVFDLSNTFTF